MYQFKVNEYISLKLENGKTNIYVKDELFRQCKFLLLFLSNDNIPMLEEIDSIDQASEQLHFALDPDTDYVEPEVKDKLRGITPETEFWAHCSNLHAWAENDYDTRILHRNLAFPLLKKLTEAGDSMARRIFKEEIGKRYFSGRKNVQEYLEIEGYLDLLSKEEIWSFIRSGSDVIYELENLLGIELEITTIDDNYTNILIKAGEIIRLDLSHLNILELPECIQRLRHLEMVNLVGNKLEEIPKWIGRLKSLRKLDAEANKITEIPNSIGNLISLETLELAQNKLKRLPESIGNLTHLKELILYDNQIEFLPESIGNLKNLQRLNLNKNRVLELPLTVENLENLKILDLRYNPIAKLPDNLFMVKSLKTLLLQETNIKLTDEQKEILKEKKIDFYY